MNRPQRVEGGWLWVGGPVPPRCSAVSFGSVVIVRTSITASGRADEVVRRERARSQRVAELGWVRYIARYARHYAGFRARGYTHGQATVRVPLEVEARVDARALVASRVETSVPVGAVGSPAVRRVDAAPPIPVTPPVLR